MDLNIQLFAIYLTEECELSEETVKSYVFAVTKFFDRFGELTKYNLLQYKAWLQEQGNSPHTVNIRLSAINKFCKFQGHPELCVKRLKVAKKHFDDNVITEEEYQKLLNCLKKDGNMKWYWIIRFLAQSGARVSEFVRVPKSILKTGFCELYTKGKYRRIYIPDRFIHESRAFFLEYKNDTDFLFASYCGKQLTRLGINRQLIELARRYGIRREVMHPHSFRHFYAKQFLKRNNNLSLLADLMGHENISTTSIYLRMTQEEQAKLLNDAMNW